MTPGEERVFGEQLGRMQQGIEDLQIRLSGIEKAIERRFDDQEVRLRKLDSEKVPWVWAAAHEKHADERDKQIDRLDSKWDRVKGALAVLSFAVLALGTLGVFFGH